MIIVDTTVWIDYFGGRATRHVEYLDRELGRRRFGLLDLILCEVLQGVRDEPASERVVRDLRVFEILSSGGEEQVLAAALHYRALRRQGITVRKTIDCWIATFCVRQGHSLLHQDADFDPFEKFLGLSVVHP